MNANEFLQHCKDIGVFKRLTQAKQSELASLIKLMYKTKKAIRTSEISVQLNTDKKIIDSRMKRLAKYNLVDVIGVNMKYVKDSKYETASFPGEINDTVKKHIKFLWDDALQRLEILNLIIIILRSFCQENSEHQNKSEAFISYLNENTVNETMFIDNLVTLIGNENLLGFYEMTYKKIVEEDLYQETCKYGLLNRQCRAHRYILKVNTKK